MTTTATGLDFTAGWFSALAAALVHAHVGGLSGVLLGCGLGLVLAFWWGFTRRFGLLFARDLKLRKVRFDLRADVSEYQEALDKMTGRRPPGPE